MTRRTLVALWLLLFARTLPAQGQTDSNVRPLTILHSNDLHAHLLPNDLDLGGFARLATEVRKQKGACGACLYLNAGDLVQGTPVSTFYRGLPVYEIANLLRIDVGTLGNHEFDYGWPRVQQFARVAKYPIISANVVDSKGVSITGKPYVIETVGGIRVAIIGVVLGDLVNFVTPQDVEPWRVLPVIETVRKYARELRERSDLIVVLGHIHDEQEAKAILQQVPEVSVAVVGHTHVGYKEMMNVDGRVGVLVTSYGVELGRLDVKVDLAAKKLVSADWKKIPIDSKIEPAPDVARLVSQWEGKVSKLVDLPIGESKRRIAGEDLRHLMERAVSEELGTDLAFFNLGNIRDVLPEGRILARNVWNIFPFEDRIVVGRFKGSQLPKSVTEGKNIDPEREYTLATTDYTAINQSLPDSLGTTGLQFPKVERLQRDIVIDWIKKQKFVQ